MTRAVFDAIKMLDRVEGAMDMLAAMEGQVVTPMIRMCLIGLCEMISDVKDQLAEENEQETRGEAMMRALEEDDDA